MLAGMHSKWAAVVVTGLLGATSFATVASLQTLVLTKSQGVGHSLASNFNIAALNLGNAIGTWAGGAVIDYDPGLVFYRRRPHSLPLTGRISGSHSHLLPR
jgi:MFS transporter, DHA1 family, inner membrane transport protein